MSQDLQILLSEKDIKYALDQLAEQVIAQHTGLNSLVFVGVLSKGVPLAERLAKRIQTKIGREIPVGSLDIGLYRDDILEKGHFVEIRESQIPFDLTDKHVILVDDVLFHGRTIRAALNGLLDFGRPLKIDLLVLVDRGHRELPIHPQYVGKLCETSVSDYVTVNLLEVDAEDAVMIRSADK